MLSSRDRHHALGAQEEPASSQKRRPSGQGDDAPLPSSEACSRGLVRELPGACTQLERHVMGGGRSQRCRLGTEPWSREHLPVARESLGDFKLREGTV